MVTASIMGGMTISRFSRAASRVGIWTLLAANLLVVGSVFALGVIGVTIGSMLSWPTYLPALPSAAFLSAQLCPAARGWSYALTGSVHILWMVLAALLLPIFVIGIGGCAPA